MLLWETGDPGRSPRNSGAVQYGEEPCLDLRLARRWLSHSLMSWEQLLAPEDWNMAVCLLSPAPYTEGLGRNHAHLWVR